MKKVLKIKVDQLFTAMNQLCDTHFDAKGNSDKVITVFDDGSIAIHNASEQQKELLTD